MLPWQPFLTFYIWGAHWRHLKNTTEPSMCGGDAALCQITLTTCFNYFRHVAVLQKFDGPLVGPLFVGAPVRPNMLNMPKFASVDRCC